jgi:hypothetical protein
VTEYIDERQFRWAFPPEDIACACDDRLGETSYVEHVADLDGSDFFQGWQGVRSGASITVQPKHGVPDVFVSHKGG